jgi:hypothetical protein
MLVSMARVGDERLQNISKQIRTKLFYENEQANLLDTIPPFVRLFAPRVNSRNYLIALLGMIAYNFFCCCSFFLRWFVCFLERTDSPEIVHYTIALMEDEGGSIVTKKKMSALMTNIDGRLAVFSYACFL